MHRQLSGMETPLQTEIPRALRAFAAGRIDGRELDGLLRIQLAHESRLTAGCVEVVKALHRRGEISADSYRTLAQHTGHVLTEPIAPPSSTVSVTTRPIDAQLNVGGIIRQRFVITQEIGRGGMGYVFKAVDLLKEEAHDRNPFVAIKVLNEKYRAHPESLKILQREACKAQKLAHPNVITVFDFDRDEDNVYIVMELLDGESLDRVIASRAETGMSTTEALPIISGICNAIAYAHDQGIVHADFKPSNVFLTVDGVVKVFDFGIARAAKTGQVTTLFDPGSLFALTPAYASCEVTEGAPPEARDDIYAIACVTYELLAGRHPFELLSALQAKKANMTAQRIPGLTPRQWNTLRDGLAFSRASRPNTALEFYDGLLPRSRTNTIRLAATAAGIAAVTAAALLVPEYIDRLRERSFIEALVSADTDRIQAQLPKLLELTPAQRSVIFGNPEARNAVIRYYEQRISDAIDAKKGSYNYPKAQSLLRELATVFPDSQSVALIGENLSARRSREIMRQSDRLDFLLSRGSLIPAQGNGNVAGVLSVISRIDPKSKLLRDPRLPGAFVREARKALVRHDTSLATALVSAGLEHEPGDAALIDLRDQVTTPAEPAIRPKVAAALPSPQQHIVRTSVSQKKDAATRALRADLARGVAEQPLTISRAQALVAMADELIRRGDASGQTYKNQMMSRLSRDAVAMKATGDIENAIAFTGGAYALFPESENLKGTLSDLRAAARTAQRDSTIRQSKTAMESLMANPRDDLAWHGAVEQEFERLVNALPNDDPYLVRLVAQLSDLYLRKAVVLRSATRLTMAERMLQTSSRYASYTPQSAAAFSARLLDEEQRLAETRQSLQRSSEVRDRSAELESLRQKLLVQAQANDIRAAKESLEELRRSTPGDKRFLKKEGPEAIAQAYLRLASNMATTGRLQSAVVLVERAMAYGPSPKYFESVRDRYTRYQRLKTVLSDSTVIDARAVRAELGELVRQNPGEAVSIVPWLSRGFADRISATSDPRLAGQLAQWAREIFNEARG